MAVDPSTAPQAAEKEFFSRLLVKADV